MRIIEIIYIFNVSLLAVYGLNALLLTILYRWQRRKKRRKKRYTEQNEIIDDGIVSAEIPPHQFPYVTVQLPIYNERHVALRLLDAVVQLDWPLHCLEIQVLDDSTDDTRELIATAVADYARRGLPITHIQRSDRSGYKAGALENGMAQAKGDFIAIFDADFVPKPDFLQRLMPKFADTAIGCVQARWGHVNPNSSLLTQLQVLGIDGHFVIQQETRDQIGAFFNFNGTAGIWRVQCIEDAGGWQHDTLTEDLDLSYRAQLKGWRIAYDGGVVVSAELPVQIDAFKRQQFRWAKGSFQTAIKLIRRVWRSDNPLWRKILGSIHLTNYAVHPLMLFNLLLILPMSWSNSRLIYYSPILTIAALGPIFMYVTTLQTQAQSFWGGAKRLILLTALGTGLSVNNTRAVLEAIIGIPSEFKRTPKFAVVDQSTTWQQSSYRLPRNPILWLEIVLAIYALAILIWKINTGMYWLVFWLIWYSGGYSYVAGLALIQARRGR